MTEKLREAFRHPVLIDWRGFFDKEDQVEIVQSEIPLREV